MEWMGRERGRWVCRPAPLPSCLHPKLHTPPQGKLGVLGHRVALIQDDQLELIAVRMEREREVVLKA